MCRLPHTRFESWVSPPQARHRRATPPRGRGILQGRATSRMIFKFFLSCEQHFLLLHVHLEITTALAEVCLDLYQRQVPAGSLAELSQTLLPFTWLKKVK